jgi:hypothetical protein
VAIALQEAHSGFHVFAGGRRASVAMPNLGGSTAARR